MGYCMHTRDNSFIMKSHNLGPALQAIKEMTKQDEQLGGGGIHYQGAFRHHWSWVSTKEVLQATTFEEAMRAWRWEVEFDQDGNVIWIEFYGEKLGDDDHLWNAIAQYVEPDSYIEMQGEDGHIWRWVFEGEGVKDVAATVTFDQ